MREISPVHLLTSPRKPSLKSLHVLLNTFWPVDYLCLKTMTPSLDVIATIGSTLFGVVFRPSTSYHKRDTFLSGQNASKNRRLCYSEGFSSFPVVTRLVGSKTPILVTCQERTNFPTPPISVSLPRRDNAPF